MTPGLRPWSQLRHGGLAAFGLVALFLGGAACVGGHFKTGDPRPDLDGPTRNVIDHISLLRQARQLGPANVVPELRPAAIRAARSVARGDETLKTAAHQAALQAVADVGRHVWTFATECTDLQQFRPPPLALESPTLLIGAAAIPGQGGRTVVLLIIAEPGTSALRADHMGGGPGGTNPSPEIYAHPSTALGSCGERWPASQPPPI